MLVGAMGEYCAYCERAVEAPHLHVEHVKPQIKHKALALTWNNFLLACSSCNTYKRHYQGANRQTGILHKQAWPHLDNTFSAYTYDGDGRVDIANTLTSATHQQMARETLQMAGLNRTPAVARDYQDLGQLYDVMSRRKSACEKASVALAAYLQNPTDVQRATILNQAADTGFFSIWMQVFSAHPAVKVDLISRFKVDTACFDNQGNPLNPRKPGRI